MLIGKGVAEVRSVTSIAILHWHRFMASRRVLALAVICHCETANYIPRNALFGDIILYMCVRSDSFASILPLDFDMCTLGEGSFQKEMRRPKQNKKKVKTIEDEKPIQPQVMEQVSLIT